MECVPFVRNEAKCCIAEHDCKSMMQCRDCNLVLNVIQCRVVTNEKKKEVKMRKRCLLPFQREGSFQYACDE